MTAMRLTRFEVLELFGGVALVLPLVGIPLGFVLVPVLIGGAAGIVASRYTVRGSALVATSLVAVLLGVLVSVAVGNVDFRVLVTLIFLAYMTVAVSIGAWIGARNHFEPTEVVG
jgi:hypothetical protein